MKTWSPSPARALSEGPRPGRTVSISAASSYSNQVGFLDTVYLSIPKCGWVANTSTLHHPFFHSLQQCCGSGSGLDPDSMGSWIRIQEGKNDPQTKKKVNKFHFFEVLDVFLRVEGFSCSLDVLYGGLGISKLQFFFIKKRVNKFVGCIFLIFGHQNPGSGFT